jgi:hypothetical protein
MSRIFWSLTAIGSLSPSFFILTRPQSCERAGRLAPALPSLCCIRPRWGILGVPRDIGSQSEITARVVDANGNSDLERWVRDSDNTGRYSGIITMSESVSGAVSRFQLRHYCFWLPRDTGNSYTRSLVLARSLFRPCLGSEPTERPALASGPLPHAVRSPARAGVRRLR